MFLPVFVTNNIIKRLNEFSNKLYRIFRFRFREAEILAMAFRLALFFHSRARPPSQPGLFYERLGNGRQRDHGGSRR